MHCARLSLHGLMEHRATQPLLACKKRGEQKEECSSHLPTHTANNTLLNQFHRMYNYECETTLYLIAESIADLFESKISSGKETHISQKGATKISIYRCCSFAIRTPRNKTHQQPSSSFSYFPLFSSHPSFLSTSTFRTWRCRG